MDQHKPTQTIRKKIFFPIFIFLLTVAFGVIGYLLIGGPQWHFLDALYMTIITIFTVGYGETHDLALNPAGRIFTITLIIVGMGNILFVVSTVTSFFVDGDLKRFLWRRRMESSIQKLRNHYIVCGAGKTGIHIINELHETKRPFVVIENDPIRLTNIQNKYEEALLISGDASKNENLIAAGIEHAAGLVSVLRTDQDNMFVVISARQLNKTLRIITKNVDPEAQEKFLAAGANAVISPNTIGGLRMASVMIRPATVSFLDQMLRDKSLRIRVEEITVSQNFSGCHKPLKDSQIREKTNLLVVALQKPGTTTFVYNPTGAEILEPGVILVVIGGVEAIDVLRKFVG